MTIRAQVPLVCVGQYLSDGTKLMQIVGIDSDYVSVVDCRDSILVSDEDLPQVVEQIPTRKLGSDWYRVYSLRDSK